MTRILPPNFWNSIVSFIFGFLPQLLHNDGKDNNNNNNNIGNDGYDLPGDFRALKGVKVSFMCIGAQKAGTTWLYEMLRAHPDLSLSHSKELHFWDWYRHYGLGWYRCQYPHTHNSNNNNNNSIDKCYGEMTPCYAVLEDSSIREIRALFPQLKLIFIARDIVDRTWSALMMELRNAVRGIDRGSFANHNNNNNNNNNNNINNNNNKKPTNMLSWQEEQQTDPKFYGDDYFLERLRHSTHWSRSDYATSLRSWLKRFLLWATERAERSDFCLSAAYSNTAPGMLSLARIIAKHHFFVDRMYCN